MHLVDILCGYCIPIPMSVFVLLLADLKYYADLRQTQIQKQFSLTSCRAPTRSS